MMVSSTLSAWIDEVDDIIIARLAATFQVATPKLESLAAV